MKILFIGNSRTYRNGMPWMVASLAAEAGVECHVAVLAHRGWYLWQHVKSPDVRANILHGRYDYIVLQEHGKPFAPEPQYAEAVQTIEGWARVAGSRVVLYEPWAPLGDDALQPGIHQAHVRAAEHFHAILAPVGTDWWEQAAAHPETQLFQGDGVHPSVFGSQFAARVIWAAIEQDLKKKEKPEPSVRTVGAEVPDESNDLTILRAEETWQRAGAYYVRIQAMMRQHHIALHEEIDAHDGAGSRYIVILKNGFPVATARFFHAVDPAFTPYCGEHAVEVGRVVVLPECRGEHLGILAVREAENWARDLGYDRVMLRSRDVTVGFYEPLGYTARPEVEVIDETFNCVYMDKKL